MLWQKSQTYERSSWLCHNALSFILKNEFWLWLGYQKYGIHNSKQKSVDLLPLTVPILESLAFFYYSMKIANLGRQFIANPGNTSQSLNVGTQTLAEQVKNSIRKMQSSSLPNKI